MKKGFIFKQLHYNFYLIFLSCKSFIGRRGIGAQQLFLGEYCMETGTVQHELMHATGFYHEQSRTDRDIYVSINKDNIIPGILQHSYL